MASLRNIPLFVFIDPPAFCKTIPTVTVVTNKPAPNIEPITKFTLSSEAPPPAEIAVKTSGAPFLILIEG